MAFAMLFTFPSLEIMFTMEKLHDEECVHTNQNVWLLTNAVVSIVVGLIFILYKKLYIAVVIAVYILYVYFQMMSTIFGIVELAIGDVCFPLIGIFYIELCMHPIYLLLLGILVNKAYVFQNLSELQQSEEDCI